MRSRRGRLLSTCRPMPVWRCAESGAETVSLVSGMLAALLIERNDLDPVRALAGRGFPEELERSARRVDRVDRERLGFLARGDKEPAARVDREAARLLLGRRAGKVRQLAARGVH